VNADMESAPEPLDAWHQRRAAEWRRLRCGRVVASYGDPAAEARSLRKGCGLVDLRWRTAIRVSGEDRMRFLNGYLTCDVAALTAGQGAYGVLTSAQGRILADAVVTAGEESLRLEVPAGRVQAVTEHLARYVLADRVTFSGDEDTTQLLLVGHGLPELLALMIAAPPDAGWSSVATTLGESRVEFRREAWPRLPSYSILVSKGEASAAARSLLELGVEPVGFDAFETVRVEACVPRFGADFGDRHFPQETGFEDAISYSKGCYLGQEVVARIHYRGHVNHELRGLRIDGEAQPGAGATIELEGTQVGRLGSVVFSEPLSRSIGLAILHRKAVEIGTRVSLEGGATARVEEPGFAVAAVAGPEG
jgi:folate-binding protein YgfZ